MNISGKKTNSWINSWEKIFKKGVPDDLLKPYSHFDGILRKLIDSKAKKVLDVAMGAGRHTICLAEAKFKVYGFDFSQSALDLAQKNLSKRHLKVEMVVGNMFGIYPYPDNFFDGVVAIQAIYHGYRKHMIKALSEIHRVLKKNGILGFTVSMDKERSTMGSKGKKIIQIEADTYKALDGREKGIPHFYPSSSQLLKMLETKFDNIEIFEDNKNKYLLVTCKAR